jgi:predicted site-specific integrase-resolvase
VTHDQIRARLLTPAQAGEIWGCSEWTIRRWVAAGRLPVVDIAPPGVKKPRTRIRESDLAALTDELASGRNARRRRGAA